ncbi:MAG: hypothetical protein ABR607_06090 [Pyrinomonadaceae bacterium]
MLITKKMLLALTLVGALVGAGIGAIVTRTAQSTSAANTNYDTTRPATANLVANERTPERIAANNSSQFNTTEEQTAYRQGFDAGYATCTGNTNASSRSVAYQTAPVYRDSASNARTVSRSTRRSSNTRRVYYDYGNTTRSRSFWQKHRDKLTVAMGSGAGALIGGLIGGKKGAGIGLLGGGVGSALYTYKLRKHNRHY